MQDIWLATGNEKKRRELDRLLSPLGYRLRMQAELEDFEAPPEDAPDFAGNAAIKARALARTVHAVALADDSGLCVDVLDGRPGVHSARYAGEGATDEDRIAKLLTELRDVAQDARTARFVCSVCLAGPDGSILATFEGQCEGMITDAPRGQSGFGYDPVFVPREMPGKDAPRTFAELSPTEKDGISHRGTALQQLIAHLQPHNPNS